MPRKTGAIIPTDTNPPDTYRRVLCIPGTAEWIALVNGVLWALTQSWYWDAGTGDVEAVTARAQQMYFEFQDGTGACDVPSAIVGEIRMMANASLPDGWLYCNGSEVAKATYPDLWDAITDFWGTASNPTLNFVLPDLRNKFPIGFAQGGGAPAIGTYGGEATHVLTTAEMPAHNHALESTLTGSSATHLIWSAAFGNDTPAAYKTYDAGGGGAHNNIPPYGAVSYIIYAGV